MLHCRNSVSVFQRQTAWMPDQGTSKNRCSSLPKCQYLVTILNVFKREKSIWCWRICDPNSSLCYNMKALYTYFTQIRMIIRNAKQGKIRPRSKDCANKTYQSEPLKYFSSYNKGYANAHDSYFGVQLVCIISLCKNCSQRRLNKKLSNSIRHYLLYLFLWRSGDGTIFSQFICMAVII